MRPGAPAGCYGARMGRRLPRAGALLALALTACGDAEAPEAGDADAGAPDAAPPDARAADAGAPDAAAPDAAVPDAAASDAAASDAGPAVVGVRFEPVDVDLGTAPITGLRFLPGDRGVLVTEHAGRVAHYTPDGDRYRRLGRFAVPSRTYFDCGLISIAIDPDWERNHYVYVGYCAEDFASEIARVTYDGEDVAEAQRSRVVVLNVAPPADSAAPSLHAIGTIGFEPDGTMWTLIGDKGFGDARDRDTPIGALLRVVPQPDGGYRPAAGNAFGPGEGAPEIYALGLRHGWRATRDAAGRFFVADVGEGRFEEIDRVSTAGQSFGWSACEGPCAEPTAGEVDPVAWWPHREEHRYFDDDPDLEPESRRVAWIGQVHAPPEGVADPYEGLLDGAIVFGDRCMGWVRLLRVADGGEVVEDRFLTHLPDVVDWVTGPDGHVYVATYGACTSSEPRDAPTLLRALPIRAGERSSPGG